MLRIHLALCKRTAVAIVALFSAFEVFAAGTVAETTWRGFPAYHLTDGRSEAIVVPTLGGRVFHYGLVGGINFLWNGQPGSERGEEALYWGGDKTYIGPHTMWQFTQERMWPPPSIPDTTPHKVIKSTGKALLTTESPEWPAYRAKIRRAYQFSEDGEFVITHTVAPVPGNAVLGAIWTITQTVPSDAVYIPLSERSPYKDNFFLFGKAGLKNSLGIVSLSPSLLQLRPRLGKGFKLGAHPEKPALATVKDGVAFVQRANHQKGPYPEGADGAGLSVEVYHHDLPPPKEYTELELLSPLRRLDQGLELITKWSLHSVSRESAKEEVERLLKGSPEER